MANAVSFEVKFYSTLAVLHTHTHIHQLQRTNLDGHTNNKSFSPQRPLALYTALGRAEEAGK